MIDVDSTITVSITFVCVSSVIVSSSDISLLNVWIYLGHYNNYFSNVAGISDMQKLT